MTWKPRNRSCGRKAPSPRPDRAAASVSWVVVDGEQLTPAIRVGAARQLEEVGGFPSGGRAVVNDLGAESRALCG